MITNQITNNYYEDENVITVEFDYKRIFHPAQLSIWKLFLWTGINVAACGRRFGKSVLAIHVILIGALSKVGKYYWVTPKYSHGNTPFNELKTLAILTTEGTCKINETDRRISLSNGSIIEFKSADSPQDLRSDGLRGLVIDEAAKIKKEAWTDALMPSLTDFKDSWCLMISTPLGRNWFWELWEEGKLGKADIRTHGKMVDGVFTNFTSFDNPYASKAKIMLDKIRMPERIFQQEHLAFFLTDNGIVFIREYFNNRVEKADVYKRFISLDTASTVNKESAYSAAVVGELTFDMKLFVRFVERKKLEFVQLQYWIEELTERWNYDGLLDRLIIEYASSGISTVQSLKATAKPEIAKLVYGFVPQGKGSKYTRGLQTAAFMEKQCVLLPLYSPENKWLAPYEDELLGFTGDDKEFKDQADATNQLVIFLSSALTDGLRHRAN